MNLAVVFDIEARAGLEVGQVLRIGDFQPEMLADPFTHPWRRRHQVDPDRLDGGELCRTVNGYLAQATILQLESVHHHLGADMVRIADEVFANVIGKQFENAVDPLLGNLLPGDQTILFRQGAENDGCRDRRQAGEQVPQFDNVLAMHETLDQIVARCFLTANHVLDQPVLGQQILDFREVVLYGIGISQVIVLSAHFASSGSVQSGGHSSIATRRHGRIREFPPPACGQR